MLRRNGNEAAIKIPEFEQIFVQVKKQLPKVTEAETEEIAKFVEELLNELETKDKNAKLIIASWNSVKTMAEVMRYPEEYSTINIKPSKIIAGIEFYPVLVYSTREIYLHYIYK